MSSVQVNICCASARTQYRAKLRHLLSPRVLEFKYFSGKLKGGGLL
ncbi:uncharacterized protein PgNI_01359 [Pyricularia grisea]|uniref:Uncharacterized protein n=1 Tax=Pyricularia grisea TaxID=148305 RepID=A0A6P8BJI9_PYRGI|nr:uncharacterized protein PgNI_01359 [Pyricularia grisea]TLD16953.1 hypothetical protein PgNI_01359 [Pyricularia grisea]